MANRKGTKAITAKRPALFLPIFFFLFCVFWLSAGCGAPGEPVTRMPPVPAAIKDLAGRQAGNGVELTFTLPTNSISGEKLAAPPAVEILRGSVKVDGSADTKSFRVVYTIPGALVDNYLTDERVHFNDPIAPDETKSHPGSPVAYLVRTRASQKRASADSNSVLVRIFPVPAAIVLVETRVTESAVELSWTAPDAATVADSVAKITGYHIYRAELHPAAPGASPQTPAPGKLESPAALLGTSESNSYRDVSAVFDHTYVYTVRSISLVEGNELESPDSSPVTVTPRDVFPPAAPQGLVGAVLPGPVAGSLLVDLSWSINLETDLAGYRVYKSEQEGTRGELITKDLLPTPAVRDTSVQPGQRYWYTVTAVDRAGNESAPSTQIAVEITPPSP